LRTRLSTGTFVLLLALGAAVAVADEKDEPACLRETRTICPLVPTGLVQACLQGHVDQLSSSCRKHLSEVNDAIDRLGDSCGADADRFCPEQQTEAGQRAECLVKHRDELSPRCRKTFDAVTPK
jgi:hypothetical protein